MNIYDVVSHFILKFNVLKPRPDRTVRPEKPWTSRHHGSVSLRTGLCQKNRKPFEPRFNHTVLRTVIKPLLTVPFESEPKKNKNTEKQEKKKHNCWEEQADLTLLHSQKTSQIIQKQNKKQNLILTIKLNIYIYKKKKKKNKPIWPSLVVGRRTNGSGAADEVVLVNASSSAAVSPPPSSSSFFFFSFSFFCPSPLSLFLVFVFFLYLYFSKAPPHPRDYVGKAEDYQPSIFFTFPTWCDNSLNC